MRQKAINAELATWKLKYNKLMKAEEEAKEKRKTAWKLVTVALILMLVLTSCKTIKDPEPEPYYS